MQHCQLYKLTATAAIGGNHIVESRSKPELTILSRNARHLAPMDVITTIYLLIALQPRSTKSLYREAWVVGPDAAFAESVRPL